MLLRDEIVDVHISRPVVMGEPCRSRVKESSQIIMSTLVSPVLGDFGLNGLLTEGDVDTISLCVFNHYTEVALEKSGELVGQSGDVGFQRTYSKSVMVCKKKTQGTEG